MIEHVDFVDFIFDSKVIDILEQADYEGRGK